MLLNQVISSYCIVKEKTEEVANKYSPTFSTYTDSHNSSNSLKYEIISNSELKEKIAKFDTSAPDMCCKLKKYLFDAYNDEYESFGLNKDHEFNIGRINNIMRSLENYNLSMQSFLDAMGRTPEDLVSAYDVSLRYECIVKQ
jgi:hypothetical protein